VRQHPAGPTFDRSFWYEPWTFTRSLPPEAANRARWWLIASGILALIVGVVAIALPVIASVTTAIFVGWILIASGVAAAIYAVSHRAPLRGLEAVISLIAGLYILVFPLSGTVTLTFVLAVWFFATGILALVHAVQAGGGPAAWMAAFSGILSVILGILIAASLPSSAAWAIGLLVGINLLFWAGRALAAAWLLREIGHSGGRP
jgi:uncharacterized membrane protein HdeD (DUF308 family)